GADRLLAGGLRQRDGDDPGRRLRAVPAEQPGSGLHSAVLPARLGGDDALLRAEPEEAGGDGGPLAHRRRRGKGRRALTAAPRPLRGEGRGSDSRPSPFPFSGTPSTRISGSPPTSDGRGISSRT